VAKFVDRMVGRKQEEKEMANQSDSRKPAADVPAVSRLADYTVHGDGPESWAPGATPLTGDEHEHAEFATDYGKLGEHVTSVLEAANEAAGKIRDEARKNAGEIAARAQGEARASLEKARAETDELSHEANRLRVEAEEESRDMKQRANAYASEKRQEAERQASAVISRAKREATEHTKSAQERRLALARNVELSEQRLRQLVGGLRDLAGRLEELLQDAPKAVSGTAAEKQEQEVSIDESLRRSAAAQRFPQPHT
jgi:hypothetical protein